MMRFIAFRFLTLAAVAARAATFEQTTSGWCSPAVAAVQNKVTIVCNGVDPKALHRLNELLDKKDVELARKVAEAEKWARRYRELEQRLADETNNAGRPDLAELLADAQRSLKDGDLEKAGALLNRVDRIERSRSRARRHPSLQPRPGLRPSIQGGPSPASLRKGSSLSPRGFEVRIRLCQRAVRCQPLCRSGNPLYR